jgi:acyl-CoA synthetase (NDP forming)
MTPNLSRLLRPKSITVFGGGWAANVVEQLLKAGFDGEIWPVHPKRADVHGVKAYPNLAALPAVPDAAWIGVNRDATIDLVRGLRERGAGGAVCFASGFSETDDGADRNAALLNAAADMPIIGPNCYGALNYLDGATLWPDQHGGKRVERGVAILTQSSNIAINMTMQRRGLPIAYMLTAGNQAQIGLAQMAEALLEDDRVTAIGLHVEGVGDPAAFESLAATARKKRIPIIAIKVGASEQAQTATISHTASLAGSDAGSKAFFQRLGIPLLNSIPSFVETLKLLHVHGPLPGRDILSMSCSGGEASLVADTAMPYDLTFRPYAHAEKDAISATLNSMVTVANPLDYHTFIWGNEAAHTETFSAAMAPGFDLSMLIYDFPREDRCSTDTWEPGVVGIITATKRTNARTAIVASLAELLPEVRCEQFIAAGIAPLCGIEEAMTATAAAASIHEAWQIPDPKPLSRAKTRDLGRQSTVLTEAEAKALLAKSGVPVPKGFAISAGADARKAANRCGYPLVIKGMGIAHKTEENAVFLDINSTQSALGIAEGLLARFDTVLIEQQIVGGLVELIVGVTNDPVYGPMLTIGAGGIFTELLTDTATFLLPTTAEEIAATLESLKVGKLLAGYRGKPAADTLAAVAAILAIARFAESNADTLEELDVNPLIVCEEGAYAADALLRMRTP